MSLQALVVAPLVTGCAGYAAWTLAPAALRRAFAVAMLKLPLPRSVATTMAKQSIASASCACDGCDKGKAPVDAASRPKPLAEGGVAPIVFHPRLKKQGAGTRS